MAAFGRGDIDGYLQPCAEDFAFRAPGHGGIASTFAGRQTAKKRGRFYRGKNGDISNEA